jgi:hypothetical protein
MYSRQVQKRVHQNHHNHNNSIRTTVPAIQIFEILENSKNYEYERAQNIFTRVNLWEAYHNGKLSFHSSAPLRSPDIRKKTSVWNEV